MQPHEIDVSRWEFNIAAQLPGRAQMAYAVYLLGSEDAITVKALIRHHEVETFRNRFHGLHFTTLEQSLIELVTGFNDLASSWLKKNMLAADKNSQFETGDPG